MGFDATGGKPYKANEDGPLWYVIVGAVVVAAFVIVLFGPRLFSAGGKEQTIERLIKGRSTPEAAGLINAYGFPDPITQEFLSRLQTMDPASHAELLTRMAEDAQAGADRAQLAMLAARWGRTYALDNREDIFSSDIAYLDKALSRAQATIDVMRGFGGKVCELDALQRISSKPDLVSAYVSYGGEGYHTALRVNAELLAIVWAGREEPQTYDAPTEADLEALGQLKAAFGGPAGYDAVAAFLFGGPIAKPSGVAGPEIAGLDVCGAGEAFINGVREMPVEMKMRLWGAGFAPPLVAPDEEVS